MGEVKAVDSKQTLDQECVQSCARAASWLITLFAPKLTCDFGSDHATGLVDAVRTLENSPWVGAGSDAALQICGGPDLDANR